ncbi:hypothetical protein BDQ17DRAFT_1337315 [Cyathus striatus]|nr:hypothetical protein BDQ17DRAFT_1337315 [Cyathus striatus]
MIVTNAARYIYNTARYMHGTLRYQFTIFVHSICTWQCAVLSRIMCVSVVQYVRYARYIYGTNQYCTVHARYIEYRSVPTSPITSSSRLPFRELSHANRGE